MAPVNVRLSFTHFPFPSCKLFYAAIAIRPPPDMRRHDSVQRRHASAQRRIISSPNRSQSASLALVRR